MNEPRTTAGRGYMSFTQTKDGYWYAWLTKTQPPRDATMSTMVLFPGEVHFQCGATIEEARANLERDLQHEMERA